MLNVCLRYVILEYQGKIDILQYRRLISQLRVVSIRNLSCNISKLTFLTDINKIFVLKSIKSVTERKLYVSTMFGKTNILQK